LLEADTLGVIVIRGIVAPLGNAEMPRNISIRGEVVMKSDPKKFVDQDFQRIAKAISDPRRFDILRRIADVPELACSSLRDELPITPATLSHHIKELEDAGLIEIRKASKCIYMKLRRDMWKKYLTRLKKL
jgi:ArsR family transcriptional regulator, arsenate/arsenite/antimonite-responsive transcriptional repressor